MNNETNVAIEEQVKEILLSERNEITTSYFLTDDGKNKLPKINHSKEQIFNECLKHINDAEQGFLVYKINLPIGTKKNKWRLFDEKTSPLGVVIKNNKRFDEHSKPYACARFEIFPMMQWLVANIEAKEYSDGDIMSQDPEVIFEGNVDETSQEEVVATE